MSPASSGNLEVEKYIGACLISQSRPKLNSNSGGARDLYFTREHYIPDVHPGNYVNFDGRFRVQRCTSDRWAGGMPLISFANFQRRGRRFEQQSDVGSSSPKYEEHPNPLARLAVHTQGAPLIVTKTFNGRRNKSQKKPPGNKQPENSLSKLSGKCNENQNTSVGVDSVSVTSDESSGSGNSDNCLPRIIKPRKRRKKDRKPTHLGRSIAPDGFSTDSASPDIDTQAVNGARPYIPFVFDSNNYRLVPDALSYNKKATNKDEVSNEAPKLHHTFEDVEEVYDSLDINGNQTTTVCQCRYCDPAGQIWDVDRSCYSPFLTTPIHGTRFKFPELKVESLLPTYTSPTSTRSQHNCLIHTMSSISLDEEKDSKNVDGRNVASGSSDLEVSTEIVTSLNGHRDIEIKFFSPSSAECARVTAKSLDTVDSNFSSTQLGKKSTDFCVNNECKFASEE